ncbi:hypothetical protein EUGRSUZ_J00715 [Eucalyptus grandis]|uniref:Uncharacterized protein n=2 Tax=Eucalyptus grandis TaxID=71139 RepID=A0ACC3J2W9_EUCGR|nr:hypothetical protein EUGRSUZ_J00715 [Eucalyptus grandis]
MPINSRLTVDNDVLPDGIRVRKGEFKLKRWLDGGNGESVCFRPSYQWKYPVFHCGARMCLGKEMAYVQMKFMTAAVMAEFEVLPVGGGKNGRRMADLPYMLSLLLKLRRGLPIRLRKRRRRDSKGRRSTKDHESSYHDFHIYVCV